MSARLSSYARQTQQPAPANRSHHRAFLTPAQAAYYLRSSAEWVKILADRGHFPGTFRLPHKVGSRSTQPGHRRIPAAAVLGYLIGRGLPLPPSLVAAVTNPVAVVLGAPSGVYRLPPWAKIVTNPAVFGWVLAVERPRVVVVAPELTADVRTACLWAARFYHPHALRVVCHPADGHVALRRDEVGYEYSPDWAAIAARIETALTQTEEEPCRPDPTSRTKTTRKTMIVSA